MRWGWGIIAVLAACHARLADPAGGPDAHVTPGADAFDQVVDSADPNVDAAPLGPWGTPALIPTGTGPADDGTMSWSGRELVFALNANGTKHLYTMTYGPGGFGTPALLPFSGTADDESPRFSTDDLTLYFGSTRGGASLDIYAAHRTAVGGTWSTPAPVVGPNTGGTDKWYAPCDADHYLVVSTTAAGDTDLYEGIVGAAPAAITALNSAANETSAFLTRDCLTTYFASARGATVDLWTSHRTSVNGAWAAPTVVTDFGTAGNEEDPWTSPDSRMFTFAMATTAAPAQKQLYLSVR